jgi:hypothetical protein
LRSNLNWHILCLLAVSLGTLSAAAVTGPDSVVENYWAATQQQEGALQGSSMEVDIEASLPKLKKHGRLRGLRRISRLGRITYEALHFEGDNSVKNHVIARYLAAEVTGAVRRFAVAGRHSGPITSSSTKDSSKQSGAGTVHVFQVTPRHKLVGLFKGEVWIDADTVPARPGIRPVRQDLPPSS